MNLLVLLLLLCMALSLSAAKSNHRSTWNPYFHRHSHSIEPMVEEAEFNTSSMDALHEKRDLHALLSFTNSITLDPYGFLSNWTAENSDNICSSWYGVRCRKGTKRVVGIDLSWSEWQGPLRLEGSISPSLGNLSLSRSFNISSQWLSGTIPPQFGHLKSLQMLDLTDNYITSSIPVELGLLQKLHTLDLLVASAHLGSLSEISTLELLDLAKNNLSGPIPEDLLSILHELAVFDVSSNRLCGKIPTGTQFSTFSASSFQNNNCLWGCPLDTCRENERASRQGDSATKSSDVKEGWLYHVDKKMSLIALGIGMGIGFGGVIGLFMLWEKAKLWVIPPNIPQPYFGVYRFPI